MAACKSCAEPIIWRRNPKTGRMAPIDAEPSRKGNIGITETDYALCNAAMAHVECGEHKAHYTNHFSTCKFANMHHRSRR